MKNRIVKLTALLLSIIIVSASVFSCSFIDISFIFGDTESNTSSASSNNYKKTLTYDSFKSFNMSYSTGNFGEGEIKNTEYGYYRTVKDDKDKSIVLLVSNVKEYITALPGSIYNITKISNIVSIEITYKTDVSAVIRYGSSGSKENNYSLSKTNGKYSTVKVETSGANFFSVDSDKSSISIKSITIEYKGTNIGQSDGEKADNLRINPTVYKGNPVPGATVKVPYDVEFADGNYRVLSYKTYTYHTIEEVISNPSIAKSVSLTDPVDVAFYSIAFGTFPVNYVAKEDYADAYEYFKEDTRCFFEYSRRDGYAQSVPFRTLSGDTVYYELDIALGDNYNASSRGIGRIVFWKFGFDYQGYDNSPVVVYTDDHYSTFVEFNNCGSWLSRYDANYTVVFDTHHSTTK